MLGILVISELHNYLEQKIAHFSLTKGFYTAIGFSKLMPSYYLTTGKDSQKDGVNLINIDNITEEFLDNNIKYLLLIRESNIIDIIEKNKALKKVLLFDKGNIKIGIKSDNITWLRSKAYLNHFKTKYNMDFTELVMRQFDMICTQTPELTQSGFKGVLKYKEQILKKNVISRMGVPNFYPLVDNLTTPYDIDHKYCVDSFRSLSEGKALKPLCYTEKGLANNPNGIKDFNKPKIILIYMGRIKTENGKILFMMREIMKRLGSDYELHIFPGRFMIPNCETTVWSANNGENIQLIRDSMFYDCNNVIVHYPFGESDKLKWLQFADIGIDFSSGRPENRRSTAGHAKTLEYCYYGLRVVCDKNINNSHLVEAGKNGILLEGVPCVDDYVNAIKKIAEDDVNRNYAINKTIEDNNWDLIASELKSKFDSY
jgi:hypothetical protein